MKIRKENWAVLLDRRLLIAEAVVGMVIFAALLLHQPILRAAGALLVVHDQPQKADVILLLNGDANSRAPAAVYWFERNLAPGIVLARCADDLSVKRGIAQNETDVSVELMVDMGVPRDKITVVTTEEGVASTRDEAVVFRQYLEKRDEIERVLVVTNAFHSRRTRWILRRELRPLATPPALLMAPCSSLDFDERHWWQSEAGFLFVFNEYLKTIYYRLAY